MECTDCERVRQRVRIGENVRQALVTCCTFMRGGRGRREGGSAVRLLAGDTMSAMSTVIRSLQEWQKVSFPLTCPCAPLPLF